MHDPVPVCAGLARRARFQPLARNLPCLHGMTRTLTCLALFLMCFGCATSAEQSAVDEPEPSEPFTPSAECSDEDAVSRLHGSALGYDRIDGQFTFVSARPIGDAVALTLSDGVEDIEVETALRPDEAQFEVGDAIHVRTGPLGITLLDLEGRLIAHTGGDTGARPDPIASAALSDDVSVSFELLCDNLAPHHVSPQFCGNVIYAQYDVIVNGVAASAGETVLAASGESPGYRVEVQRIAERLGYAHEYTCADPDPTPEIGFRIVALR